MNAMTGAAVCLFVLILSLSMIIKTNEKIAKYSQGSLSTWKENSLQKLVKSFSEKHQLLG